MQRLVIDETLPEKLLKLDGRAELVAPNGELLGVFERKYDPARYDLGPGVTEAELDRRFAEDARIPGDEVVARLRKLS